MEQFWSSVWKLIPMGTKFSNGFFSITLTGKPAQLEGVTTKLTLLLSGAKLVAERILIEF